MAKDRSDKSKYPSRYSPGKWVTANQYIVELVCEQAAKYSKKDLPMQFWKQDGWQKFFLSQTRKVSQLLKKHDEKVIITVVKEKRIRSLLPKWVDKVIQTEQKKFDMAKLLAEKSKQDKPKESIIKKPSVRKKRMIGKFEQLLNLDMEIENGKESEESN